MKAIMRNLLCIFVVVTMLLGSVPAFAADIQMDIANERENISVSVVDAIKKAIESIYSENELCGFGSTSFDELCIGNEILNYEVVSDGLVEIEEISYYSILNMAVIRGIDFDSKVFSVMDPQGAGSSYYSGIITNSSGNYGTLIYTNTATNTAAGVRLTLREYLYI